MIIHASSLHCLPLPCAIHYHLCADPQMVAIWEFEILTVSGRALCTHPAVNGRVNVVAILFFYPPVLRLEVCPHQAS